MDDNVTPTLDDNAPPTPTIGQLAQQVSSLTSRIDKETTGFTGWVKWISLILALLAALFSVPKGAIDLWDSVHSRPDTKITPESSLSMTYDPKSKSIQFGFGFTISNDGKRKDTIQTISARLKRIDYDTSNDLISFGDNDFVFSEKNGRIPNHFPITESNPREIDCMLTAYLADQIKGDFLIPKSRWQLVVDLTGEYGKKNSIAYCFDISQDDLDDLFKSQQQKTSQMNNPNCEGYSR